MRRDFFCLLIVAAAAIFLLAGGARAHFVMEPEPYREPAEDGFIVHLTKAVVAAFGDDEGWDADRT